MSIFRRIWQVTQLAFAPIPKVQEGVQALFFALFLLGIVINPDEIFASLSLDFSSRLALLFGLLCFLFTLAALRIQYRLSLRPLTLEFEKFQSTIRIRSYKKQDNQEFEDFKVDVKLLVRPINNEVHAISMKSLTMMLMKKGFLVGSRVISDTRGSHLLTRYTDKTYVSFLYDGISIQAKSLGSYYFIERTFEIESLGFFLLNKDRYFFRLIMDAVGQTDVVVDVIPDWDDVPINGGTLQDTVKEFRFRD